MPARPPRLADVAELAGVSEATASRVVNGRPVVAAATRERVYDAIRELGYVRGPQVADVTHDRVGIVLPDIENPIFPRFAKNLATYFLAAGHSPLFGLISELMMEADIVASMRASRLAGIVFVAGNHATQDVPDAQEDLHLDHYRRLIASETPFVLINGTIDGFPVPMVATDEHFAVRLALDHLIALGHRRVGLVMGSERTWSAREKIAGWHQLVETRDLDMAPVEHSLFTVSGGNRAARRMFDRGVTGIVAGSDLMALGVVQAAHEDGRSVPGDVSVVGYDDSTLMSLAGPPLTTVRQDVDAISRHAVGRLLDGIAGRAVVTGETLFRPELIVRSSTGPAPAGR
jgi:DNA-binding LacI/PurR family transcriptional regulator